MQLTIVNLTGSTKSYLSGVVTVAGNSSTSVTDQTQQLSLVSDGQLHSDIINALVNISDGVNTYGNTDALSYLQLLMRDIGPISDSNGALITLGQKVSASSVPVVLPSDQIVSVSTGSSVGKTLVMKTGNLSTLSSTANQVILTYTVTSGKTLYLELFDVLAWAAALTASPSTSAINCGLISFQINGVTQWQTNWLNASNGGNVPTVREFSEALPIASGSVVRFVVTPNSASAFTWLCNIVGYEK